MNVFSTLTREEDGIGYFTFVVAFLGMQQCDNSVKEIFKDFNIYIPNG